jgi:DNA repair protein RadC
MMLIRKLWRDFWRGRVIRKIDTPEGANGIIVKKNNLVLCAQNLSPEPGNPEPSEDDLEITKRLMKAGIILGIDVIDHIIVARDGFLSFKVEGD